MSERSAETALTAIDARHCAFICWVDLDGSVHMTSHTGYSQRQVATMMRQVAAVADRKADESGETADATLPPGSPTQDGA